MLPFQPTIATFVDYSVMAMPAWLSLTSKEGLTVPRVVVLGMTRVEGLVVGPVSMVALPAPWGSASAPADSPQSLGNIPMA